MERTARETSEMATILREHAGDVGLAPLELLRRLRELGLVGRLGLGDLLAARLLGGFGGLGRGRRGGGLLLLVVAAGGDHQGAREQERDRQREPGHRGR